MGNNMPQGPKNEQNKGVNGREKGPDMRGHFDGSAPDDPEIHNETHAEFEDKMNQAGGLDELLAKEDADEVIERAREKAKKRRDETNDDERETDEKRGQKAGFNEKSGATPDGEENSMAYRGYHLRDHVSYGIKDKGSYYNFNNKKVSDKQLRRMILRGHLDKGWKTLYFYDHKGKIDQELTQRANKIIGSFAKSDDPKLAKIGASVSASSSRMPELEPFLKGKPIKMLERKMEEIGMKWDSTKQGWKNTGVPLLPSKGISSLVS